MRAHNPLSLKYFHAVQSGSPHTYLLKSHVGKASVYIFTFNDRYDIDGSLLRNTARYSNHSCDPNCEIEKTTRMIWLVALRDITDGEELTYNYGYAYHPAD